jgi:tetratricopeptide (TPR) repeat protein
MRLSLDAGRQTQSNNESTHYNQAMKYINSNDWLAAREQLEKHLKKSPNDAIALYELGIVLSHLTSHVSNKNDAMNMLRKTVAVFEHVIETNPRNFNAWLRWGDAVTDLLDAETDLERKKILLVKSKEKITGILKDHPDNPECIFVFGALKIQQAALADAEGQQWLRLYRTGVEKMTWAVERMPDNKEALSVWATYTMSLTNLERAPEKKIDLLRTITNKLKDSSINDFGLAYFFGVANVQLAESEPNPQKAKCLMSKAINRFRILTDMHPNNALALYSLANALEKKAAMESDNKQWSMLIDEAMELHRKISQHKPFSYANTFIVMGDAYRRNIENVNDPARKLLMINTAIELYRYYLKIIGEDTEVLRRICEALMQQSEYMEDIKAMAIFEGQVKNEPQGKISDGQTGDN